MHGVRLEEGRGCPAPEHGRRLPEIRTSGRRNCPLRRILQTPGYLVVPGVKGVLLRCGRLSQTQGQAPLNEQPTRKRVGCSRAPEGQAPPDHPEKEDRLLPTRLSSPPYAQARELPGVFGFALCAQRDCRAERMIVYGLPAEPVPRKCRVGFKVQPVKGAVS